jgi:hypothetical protein
MPPFVSTLSYLQLSQRGMARFEVLARRTDRELIRLLDTNILSNATNDGRA